MKNKTVKIFWAVNPHNEFFDLWEEAKLLIGQVSVSFDVCIQPFYLFSGSDHLWAKVFSDDRSEIELRLKDSIANGLKAIGAKDFEEPQIVFSDSLTQRGAIQDLAQHLKNQACDLLLINRFEKKGLEKLFLGSFAEGLLLQVPCPLIINSPGAGAAAGTRSVLYPTDFSDFAKVAFEDFLNHRFGLVEEVILFSKLVYPVADFPKASVYTSDCNITVSEYWDKIYELRSVASAEWEALAEKHGVKIKVVVDREPGNLVDSIVEKAEKEKVDMIAMTSFVDKGSAFFTGSFTRGLVRATHKPVYIRHYFS